jgi:hypothetical protein
MNSFIHLNLRKIISLFAVSSLFISTTLYAQNGIIRGSVKNAINNEALPSVTVIIQGTSTGALTDANGKYSIEKLKPGF